MRPRGSGVALALALAAVAALGGCESDAPEPSIPPPLSVLLVSFDTTRPDALGPYGDEGGHTPAIDAFARGATVFEEAVAPMGATFPSHATMLTGLYPRQHGVRANHDRLAADTRTLAEILRQRGYDTAAFVSFGSMLSRGGLHQGFTVVSDEPTGRSTGSIRSGDEITRLAVDWLRAERDRPFFLWLHYFEAHAPYRLTPYAAKELSGYAGPLARGADVKTFYSLGGKIPWTPEERRAVQVLYDGEVRELDRLIAPVLDALVRSGRADDTLVVLTADHGQALGEEGAVGHGLSLAESVLRVPLIVRHPRLEEAPARVPGRVGLVDLTPTLLDLLGAAPPEAVDGRSFAPALRGAPLPDRPYYAEMNEPLWDKDPTKIRRTDVAVYEGKLKSVHDRRGSRTFDLSRDPGAVSPLPKDERGVRAEELEELARDYHAARREHSGRVKDPEVAEELRALGYLE